MTNDQAIDVLVRLRTAIMALESARRATPDDREGREVKERISAALDLAREAKARTLLKIRPSVRE